VPKVQSIKKYRGFSIGDIVKFREPDNYTTKHRFKIISFPPYLYQDSIEYWKHRFFASCERLDKKEDKRRCLDTSIIRKDRSS
jgi:hypothetical protein